MMHRLIHGVMPAVVIVLLGCQSTPTPDWARERIGFSRVLQLGGTETLWIMHGDGSGQSPLELGAEGNSSLTWSPDGNDIAFQSIRDGNLEIYTARIIDNGDHTYSAEDIRRRTTSPADDLSPSWSHDCARIAFSSNRANQHSFNIYQLDIKTDIVAPVTNGNDEDLSPSWSLDGSKIAFTRTLEDGSREIYVHLMSSGEDIRLTTNAVNDTDPSWSPAGRIIFARHSEDGSRAALFEMDPVDADGDGNGDHVDPITLPQANEYDQKPEYFRGGNAIVFLRSQMAGSGGPGDVWRLLIQNGTIMEPLRNLTDTHLQDEHGATWKRNGVCVRNGRDLGPVGPPAVMR